MNRKTPSSFLDEEVGLLVHHFGADRVRAALAKVSNGVAGSAEPQVRRTSSKPDDKATPSITSTLEEIRKSDEQKYRQLTDFYTQLKDRKVLPESQDIRHFTHVIGLKEIDGKSCKELIPRLMRFLFEHSKEQLQVDVEAAASISEQQRQQGYSVLTDKLLGD